ncbi:MAG TPA: YtxH domain-containing protein [Armatimonadota bacterium]|nr:YtxH domain-containing protein [Armatimonadota bacterium]
MKRIGFTLGIVVGSVAGLLLATRRGPLAGIAEQGVSGMRRMLGELETPAARRAARDACAPTL